MVIFGQELPDATATLAAQLFGLGVALLGLATFALVLALLQQVRWLSEEQGLFARRSAKET